jgi:chemotaxis protein CheZ
MPAPRKIFRIEESVAAHHVREDAAPPNHHTEIMQALAALRTSFATPAPRPAAFDPAPALNTAELSRMGDELQAVITSSAQATQKILAAAEEIDQLAHNLAATLKGRIEQGAAQDMSDLVVRIFEACNFQDLTGQHVAKVMARLRAIEDGAKDSIKREAPAAASKLPLHGPKLDNDSGHISQAEIDALFDN